MAHDVILTRAVYINRAAACAWLGITRRRMPLDADSPLSEPARRARESLTFSSGDADSPLSKPARRATRAGNQGDASGLV